jgi:hypothetical protein
MLAPKYQDMLSERAARLKILIPPAASVTTDPPMPETPMNFYSFQQVQ